MKKLILITSFFVATLVSYAQHDNTVTISNSSDSYPGILIYAHDDVNSTPTSHPRINFLTSDGTNANKLPIEANRALGSFIFSGWNSSEFKQAARIQVNTLSTFSASSNDVRMDFNVGSPYVPSMSINGATGNVGIGLNYSNASEKLTVNGKILCEEVEVVQNVLPDYVFQKYYTGSSTLKEDYKMPTLEEVEVFTKANFHLPEVPSAKEVKENGMELKEMTSILLQKIEELTLYTIEQEKRIKTLEANLAEKQ